MSEAIKTRLPTPQVIYGSGGGVAIFREYTGDGGENANVTDMGIGLLEASQIGAETEYQEQAKRLADDAGLLVRHGAVIAEDVKPDQIDAAAQWVAHVSTVALSLATYLTEPDHSPNERG